MTGPAIAGPVIYAEAFVGIGERRYLVRFYDFRANGADRVVTRRPSLVAAAAEGAFWETLRSWSPDTDRPPSRPGLCTGTLCGWHSSARTGGSCLPSPSAPGTGSQTRTRPRTLPDTSGR